jgi:hypothetical protein
MTEEEYKKSLSNSLQKAANKNEQERDKDDQPFLSSVAKTLEDIAVQTAGGIVDASESAYNFVVPKSMEVEYSDIVPEAETKVGAFIRPAAQFFIPYTGAFKIAKGGYMYVKNAKQLNSTVKDLVAKGIKKENIVTKKSKDGQKFVFLEKGKVKEKVYKPVTRTIKTKTVKEIEPKTSNDVLMLQLGGSPKTISIPGRKKVTFDKQVDRIRTVTKKVDEKPIKTSLTKGETAGIAIGAGAASDAIAFAPYDPNLADFLVRFPATKNAVTQWLQTDPNGDPGMERLKNAISGGIPSVFIPAFLAGVSKGFVWSKNKIGKAGADFLLKDTEPKAGQIYIDKSGDRIQILDILEPNKKLGITTRTVRTKNLDKTSREVSTDSYDTFLNSVRAGNIKLQNVGTTTSKVIGAEKTATKGGTPKKVKGKEEVDETAGGEQKADIDGQMKSILKPKDSEYAVGRQIAEKIPAIQKLKLNFFNSSVAKKFVIDFLDSNRGLKYLEDAASKKGVSLPRLKNLYSEGLGVYQEARFLNAMGGMVEHFLFKGTFKYNNAGQMVGTTNDGLQGILEKSLGKKHNADEFFNYLGTKSILSMDKSKFESLFPDAKLRNQIKKDAKKGDAIPEYQAALKGLDTFNRELIDLAVDAQLISRETADKLLAARKHYVPLYRDMSADDSFLSRARGGGVAVKRKLEAKVPIGFDKDQLPLKNLFDNYVENINSIITASYKNKVLRNTFDLIDEGKLDDWAELAEGQGKKKTVVTLKAEELKTQVFKQKGTELDINDLEDLDNLNLFRSERMQLKENEFVVFRKNKQGKIEKSIYEVKNPLLFATLNAISPKQFATANAFVRIARSFKNLLTKGVTMDPGFFAGANALRDTFSAAILSRNRFYIPILSTAVKTSQRFQSNAKVTLADGTVTTYKKLYEEFLLNGGSFGSTLWRGEVSEGFLKEFHRKLGSNYKDVLDRPKKVIDRYGDVVTGFENASRFTEFAMLRARGISAREAAFAAREVAVDFGMHGANQFFRNYTSMVPFLNAGIQGIYRTVRAIKSPAERAAVGAKIAAFVGTPTLLLYILNRDDPNYKNTAQQIRDLNYMIPIGDGNFIKIPKPFEFGAIGTILTSMFETFDGTKEADDFFLTAWTVLKNQARLSVVPQVVSPLVNTAFNKTFFGSPVIPENMRHSLPDYGQSYPWSSNVITSAIENAPPNIRKYLMSPIKFENYYRAYTGAVGGYILDLIDSTLDIFNDNKMPSKRLDELIFVKRFLQLDPIKFTQAEAEFYRLRKEADKAVNIAKKFKDENKVELLQELYKDEEFTNLLALSPKLERIARVVSNVNQQRNAIIENKSFSKEQKRFKIDLLEGQLADLFKQLMDEIDANDLGL